MYNADIQYSRVYVAVSPRFSPLTTSQSYLLQSILILALKVTPKEKGSHFSQRLLGSEQISTRSK